MHEDSPQDSTHDRDSLHRFDFESLAIRGQLLHLDSSWQAMLEHRNYPVAIRNLLGQAMAAAALLSSTIKFDGQLTLQLQGDGPMHLLLAQCTANFNVRGLARFNESHVDQQVLHETESTIQQLAGQGKITVTIESEDLKQRYQGIVALSGTQLAQCLEVYFAQSEQLPTRMWLHADEQGVAGMLLQRLPTPKILDDRSDDAEKDAKLKQQQALLDDAWHRVQLIGDTLRPEELRELSDREILYRLFNEDDLRLFESSPVYFRCRCSRERVSGMLQSLGKEEIDSIIAEQARVEVRCEFCERQYSFDSIDVAQIFNTSISGDAGMRRH
jgi:molecular chaperone Hsp33